MSPDRTDAPSSGLILFGTAGCHLCEEAEALLGQAITAFPALQPVTVIDIAEGADWLERYGTRIPVLLHRPTGAELGWPFSLDEVRAFLGGFAERR